MTDEPLDCSTTGKKLHQVIEGFEKAIFEAIGTAHLRNEDMYSLGTYHTLCIICKEVTSPKIIGIMADFRMELYKKGYFV